MRCSMPLWAAALTLASAMPAAADDLSVKQSAPPGWHGEGVVVTPESSVPKPGDAGKRAHTNTKVFVPTYGASKKRGSNGDSAPEPTQPR
ncbi:MAG: hypothetical protein ACRECC_05495 [Pseudolabrys sp.]